jgi:hypothetical protein
MGGHSSVDPSFSAFGRRDLRMMDQLHMVMAKARVDVVSPLLESQAPGVERQRAFLRDRIDAFLQKKLSAFS